MGQTEPDRALGCRVLVRWRQTAGPKVMASALSYAIFPVAWPVQSLVRPASPYHHSAVGTIGATRHPAKAAGAAQRSRTHAPPRRALGAASTLVMAPGIDSSSSPAARNDARRSGIGLSVAPSTLLCTRGSKVRRLELIGV